MDTVTRNVALLLIVVGTFAVSSAYSSPELVYEDSKLVVSTTHHYPNPWIKALNNGIAIVGAPEDYTCAYASGSAFVVARGNGSWSEQQKLQLSDCMVGDQLGNAADVDGDVAVIGAVGRNSHSGAAYVFERDMDTWVQTISLGQGLRKNQFGRSVAIAGDHILVGSPGLWDWTGRVLAFSKINGEWTYTQELFGSAGQYRAVFGWVVAIDGDTAVIGARGMDAVYVYILVDGEWVAQQKIVIPEPADIQPGVPAEFGFSVAVEGDTLIVSATSALSSGVRSGAAYVFARSEDVWSYKQKLTRGTGNTNDSFGYDIEIEQDVVVIGAPGSEDIGPNMGLAHVFTRTGEMWEEAFWLGPSDGEEYSYFGSSVGIDQGTIMVGASTNPSDAEIAGGVYVFSGLTDREGPVVRNLEMSPNPVGAQTEIVVTAVLDDSMTGGSAIESALAEFPGGTSLPLAPVDGSFNDPIEAVTGTLLGGLDVGLHDVCVWGVDALGNQGAAECATIAVYDPSAGFVTGGGWFLSPEGAYPLAPELAGRATFGFVSKYQHGRNRPTGNTQFQFKAGDLNFHSDTYQWLVVAGAQAKFKGMGKINGQGNFGFMITALDASLTPSAEVDGFRIKIWDLDNADTVVYDNQFGEDDNSGATSEIGGGAILIHVPAKK